MPPACRDRPARARHEYVDIVSEHLDQVAPTTMWTVWFGREEDRADLDAEGEARHELVPGARGGPCPKVVLSAARHAAHARPMTTTASSLQGLPETAATAKEAHRRFPTGVTVVTTTVDGTPYGLAVNAFSSVSMDPPMVLVCVKSTSQTHPHLEISDHIGINILANDQEWIAQAFASSGGDKFAGISWHSSLTGAPLLDGAAAAFEVKIDQRIPAGSHTIFLGEVVAVEAEGERQPLLYLGGAFHDSSSLADH